MQAHVEVAHRGLLGQPLASIVKTLRIPKEPPAPKDLPVLPRDLVPAYMLLCPPVWSAWRRAPSASQAAARGRRWKRMNMPRSEEEEDEDESAICLEDIKPSSLQDHTACRQYIILRRPVETFLQLSRPQPIQVPPVRPATPPVSIGFDAFAARFEQLDLAGLIDGSGQWPPEPEDESHGSW